MKKIMDTGKKIQQRQVEFADIAAKAMASMVQSQSQEGSYQEKLLVGNQQQWKISDEEMQLSSGVDFYSNVIAQRKEDINNIADIMANINDMAKDLAIETKKQGQKLNKLDQDLGTADNNAETALKELGSAVKQQKKAGKCQACLMWLIVCILIGVSLIIYFNYR